MSDGLPPVAEQPKPFDIPGVSVPGAEGPAAPDSVLGQLRATARQERARRMLTLELPGRWEGLLRARYSSVPPEELDRVQDLASKEITGRDLFTASLELMSRACQAIEAHNRETGEWEVLEDAAGPVTFDDRLARLIGLERPTGNPDFQFSIRQTYEAMFDYDGALMARHVGSFNDFAGLVDEAVLRLGEASAADG